MIDTDKYEELLENGMQHRDLWELASELLAEVKRLRLLFRELINDMNADDYIEWCNKIGCPDGLEVYAMTGDDE